MNILLNEECKMFIIFTLLEKKINPGEVLHGAQAILSAAEAYMQISSLLLKSGATAAGQSSLAAGWLVLGKKILYLGKTSSNGRSEGSRILLK